MNLISDWNEEPVTHKPADVKDEEELAMIKQKIGSK
jgi:hypothetical protein